MKKRKIDWRFLFALSYPVVAMVVIIILLAKYYMYKQDAIAYRVVCLNSEQNNVTDEESYFFDDKNNIYRYDFETEETELIYESALDKNLWNVNRRMFTIYQDYLFFVNENNGNGPELHRYNYKTKDDEVLLGKDYVDGIDAMDICNGYLIYRIRRENYFLYPAVDIAGKEPIDIANIFNEKGDITNPDIQTIAYEGMDIVGYFDSTAEEKLCIRGIREHESGNEILPSKTRFLLKDGRNMLFLTGYKAEGGRAYYARCFDSNGDEDYEVTCLYKKDLGVYPEFWTEYIMQEGDEIICLLQINRSEWPDERVLWQYDSRGDILFKWNIKTGESSVLYETSNRNTRIIGYKNGNIYLLHNYWVSVQSVDTGKREKLFKIPKRREIYYFDWQGDYLIVTDIHRQNEVLTVYKIE